MFLFTLRKKKANLDIFFIDLMPYMSLFILRSMHVGTWIVIFHSVSSLGLRH